MAESALIGAFLVGLLGGVHCLAMCGGFVAAISVRDGSVPGNGTAPLLPARVIVRRQLGYHAGRICAYVILGTAFGAAGAAAIGAAGFVPIQRGLYVAANAFLLLLAASLVTRSLAVEGLQRAGARAFGAALPALRPLLQRPGMLGRAGLGIVWGFVPCALVYGLLPLALFSGSAWQGAAVMLAFGIGTLPNLLGANLLFSRLRPLTVHRGWRAAAAALIAGFALLGIYRALYDPGALAHGPFCLLP
ncbi:MAG TPA: sulfite exporter TauE/SafE family protein [Casimicrobiaceae bacterium]|nr:sulfite exporter TauE/SafE family protein [Casimicrobiaceae bacterium]